MTTRSKKKFYQVYYAYWNGSSWSDSTKILGQPATDGFVRSLESDSNGNAIALTTQQTGTTDYYQVYCTYWNGSDWTVPEEIPGQDPESFDSGEGKVVFDSNNNAIAIFTSESPFQVYFSTWNGSSWSNAAKIAGQSPNLADNIDAVIDINDNVIAVWQQQDPSNYYQIYYAIWSGSDWTIPEKIPGQPLRYGSNPQVAVDLAGDAIAVWHQDSGLSYQIFYSLWDGTQWTNAEKIPGQTEEADANLPQIALDANGNAIAIWEKNNGINYQIFYSFWDGAQWTDAKKIPGTPQSTGHNAQISFDTIGNALAIWSQNTGPVFQVFHARWNGSEWINTAAIPGQPQANPKPPQIALDNNNNAMAFWGQYSDSAYHFFYSRYIFTSTKRSFQKSKHLSSQTDLINQVELITSQNHESNYQKAVTINENQKDTIKNNA